MQEKKSQKVCICFVKLMVQNNVQNKISLKYFKVKAIFSMLNFFFTMNNI